jgi:hypothetical protein
MVGTSILNSNPNTPNAAAALNRVQPPPFSIQQQPPQLPQGIIKRTKKIYILTGSFFKLKYLIIEFR